MADMTIDLRALLVEREDCDAGTVQKVREALAQGGTQFRSLREVTDLLVKRLDAAQGPVVKKWNLKLGVAYYFLGHTVDSANHLREAEGALASFLLGRALVSLGDFEEALKAFERAEKSGYNASQVHLQRAAVYRQRNDLAQARTILEKLGDLSSHNAEYHFQLASICLAEGERQKAIVSLERSVELDPSHTGALFQLGHANDLAGNDDDAIAYYEACLRHPPVHVGTLKNLGILYEDHEKYDKAVECFRRILAIRHLDEEARLFLKDAQASLNMYYNPDEDERNTRFSQVLEIPVTDFELSVRARNCLKKMNIRSLGDLTRVTREQLLASKNFGETSLKEIEDMLAAKNLRLGQSIEDGGQPEMRFRAQQPLSEQEQAVLNKPVSDLNLSVRARKCMNRLGIATLGELIQRSSDELLESKNFGMTSLNEVREKLQILGLHLRGE